MAAKLSIRRAVLWIVLSTLLISGTAIAGFWYWCRLQQQRLSDERFSITQLLQAGPLSTDYLARLLDLSCDQPYSLYAVDPLQAAAQLTESPVIFTASVVRVPPAALRLDYTAPVPLAQLGEELSTGVDAAGHLFPLEPFFATTGWSQLVIGLEPCGKPAWQVDLPMQRLRLALAVLEEGNRLGLHLDAVDTRACDATLAGRREIVAQVICGNQQLLLRLPLCGWQVALQRYHRLTQWLEVANTDCSIVDLRLDQLAFLS